MSTKFQRKKYKKETGQKSEEFFDGMYFYEIQLQCEFGIRAFGEMQHAFKIEKQHPSLLALSHMILIFAGNVAKLLSVSGDSNQIAKTRAKRLCDELKLDPEKFPEIRRARNYFEHFDERVDRYLGSTEGMLMHRTVLDHQPEEIELDDGRKFQPKFLQFLNTNTLELVLYNEKFALAPIVETLVDIKKRVNEKLDER